MNKQHELEKSVARMMCAAYWRGKLESSVSDKAILEALIEQAMEAQWKQWLRSAQVACGGDCLIGAHEHPASV